MWGQYDLLLLPPSFPYGGAVLLALLCIGLAQGLHRRPSRWHTHSSSESGVACRHGKPLPYVLHADPDCRGPLSGAPRGPPRLMAGTNLRALRAA